MSIRVQLNKCQKCSIGIHINRYINTDNTIHPNKMHTKLDVLSQWKLINYVRKIIAQSEVYSKYCHNGLNKEFAQFLQKFQPSIYGSDFIRYIDTMFLEKQKKFQNVSNKATSVQSSDVNNNSEGLSIPRILDNIMLQTSQKKLKKIDPEWKEANSVKGYIDLRTHELIKILSESQPSNRKFSAVEELCNHMRQHPEAKHIAVKQGAIKLLLKMYYNLKEYDDRAGLLNECLTRLGYTHPVSGNGVRILSIDGGGVRGILVIEMLKKLEELTGKRIHEMFDIICGVSTGAIIATLIGTKQKSLDEISDIYKNISTQIFTQSPLKGTSNLVWSHSYYDTTLWEKLLKDTLGDETLISSSRRRGAPKICVVSSIVNESRLSAYLFRNYDLPCRVKSNYRGNHEHKVWEAVRASAAAPTYFEEFKLGKMLHQDGGILINNPCAVALHEAKLLWPETPLQCVISFGTGRSVPSTIDAHQSSNNSSWKNKFFAIIESATDTEGVHTMLSDLLAENVYYRFNPYLTEMLDIAEIDPAKIEQLQRDAVMYLRRNEDKFQEAAKALKEEKSWARKTVEWIQLQTDMLNGNTKLTKL